MHEDDQSLPIIKKEPPHRSARCDDAPPGLLLEGIAQFNAGEYWECHETLETIWRVEPDHIRYLYQGILQVGVGFYHLGNGNWRGATGLLRNGTIRLKEFEPVTLNIDVTRLVRECEGCLRELEKLGRERVREFDQTKVPKIVVTDQPEALGSR